jgi:hypothetical protein
MQLMKGQSPLRKAWYADDVLHDGKDVRVIRRLSAERGEVERAKCV